MVEVLNVLSADNHVTVFNLKVRALQQHCSRDTFCTSSSLSCSSNCICTQIVSNIFTKLDRSGKIQTSRVSFSSLG